MPESHYWNRSGLKYPCSTPSNRRYLICASNSMKFEGENRANDADMCVLYRDAFSLLKVPNKRLIEGMVFYLMYSLFLKLLTSV